MKRFFLFAAALLSLASLHALDPQVLDGVAAVVNGDVVTFSQVRELTTPQENSIRANFSGSAQMEKIKEIRLRAVNDLIERQLIIQEFRKMKGAMIPPHVIESRIITIIREEFGGDRSAFLRTIAAQGYTLDRLRRMEEEKVIVQAMRAREVKVEPIIPQGKVEAFYHEHMQEWTTNDEVKLRMIKVIAASEPEKKRRMIQEIRDRLVRGSDFADLARIYSEDSTQDKGGDYGWVKRGDLNPELERLVFAQKTGKPSEVIDLTLLGQQAYYLLLAEERKGGVTKPLSEVRDQIGKFLAQQERQKLQQVWLERLRKKAYIKIYEGRPGCMTSATVAKYARVFNAGLQNTFTYRWNFILRSIFGIVPLIGTIYLWSAMYGGDAARQLSGYTFNALITYFAATVFVENLITPTDDEWQIAADIRDGRLSALLLKPLNYLAYRFTLYASYRLLYSAIILPGVILVFFFLRQYITLPTAPQTWLAFALSTGLAALIQFFLAYALAMLAFWLLEISTIIFIVFSFEYFLAGHIFPLDMLPSWLAGVIKWSPFTYELYFPVQIFMERVRGPALVEGLLIQTGWAVVLWLLAITMWRAGLRKYQAVGG